MKRLAGKILAGTGLGFLFLLPLFGWIAAEPVPYEDPEGFFSIVVPDGWKADDSSHMGKGVMMKGPADADGVEPVVHLIHEATGIVTLDVQWLTHLGRLRYDLTKVKFLSLEDHEEEAPPHYQGFYTYLEGERSRKAVVRLTLHGDRFYLVTATAAEESFEKRLPLFLSAIDSLRPGEK